MIDWIEFYALTAIFQAYKGGKIVEQFFNIEIRNIRISIRHYFIFYQLAVNGLHCFCLDYRFKFFSIDTTSRKTGPGMSSTLPGFLFEMNGLPISLSLLSFVSNKINVGSWMAGTLVIKKTHLVSPAYNPIPKTSSG